MAMIGAGAGFQSPGSHVINSLAGGKKYVLMNDCSCDEFISNAVRLPNIELKAVNTTATTRVPVVMSLAWIFIHGHIDKFLRIVVQVMRVHRLQYPSGTINKSKLYAIHINRMLGLSTMFVCPCNWGRKSVFTYKHDSTSPIKRAIDENRIR
jgi:hypothetical protein